LLLSRSTASAQISRLTVEMAPVETCVYYRTASVVYWSEFLATDPEARVRFPALSEKKVMGLELRHHAMKTYGDMEVERHQH
jgi:hypothetical protein